MSPYSTLKYTTTNYVVAVNYLVPKKGQREGVGTARWPFSGGNVEGLPTAIPKDILIPAAEGPH